MTLGEWAEWFSIYGPRPNRANWPKTYPPCLVCQKNQLISFFSPISSLREVQSPQPVVITLQILIRILFYFLSLILLWQSKFFSKRIILMKYEWVSWSCRVIFLDHCLKLAILGCMLCPFRFEWFIPSVLLGLIPNSFCNVTDKNILDKIFGDLKEYYKIHTLPRLTLTFIVLPWVSLWHFEKSCNGCESVQ